MEYLYCYKEKCYDKTYIVKPSNVDKNAVIKIVTDYEIDSEISLNKKLANVEDTFECFGKIKYRYLGVTREVQAKKITADYLKNNVAYLEVPSEVTDANKIELILSIRGKNITIILK